MFEADRHSARLTARRVELVSVDDGGEHQTATSNGYFDETIKDAHRVQPFGFSANPPAGSHGVLLAMNGRQDQAVIVGAEHQDYRPKGLKSGGSRQYDTAGSMVDLDADGNLHVKANGKKVIIDGATAVEINCAAGIVLNGPVTIIGDLTQTGSIHSTGVHQAGGGHV